MSDRWSLATLVWTLLVLTASWTTSAWPFQRRDVLDNAVDSPGGLIAHLQHLGESLYRLPDNETGLKVAQWHEGMDVNPEELGNYAEGDILFPPIFGRNGLKAETARWPAGVVPFVISPYFSEYLGKNPQLFDTHTYIELVALDFPLMFLNIYVDIYGIAKRKGFETSYYSKIII